MLASPINNVDVATSRIGFLKEEELCETSKAGKQSTGDEPSAVSKVDRAEIEDAVPVSS